MKSIEIGDQVRMRIARVISVSDGQEIANYSGQTGTVIGIERVRGKMHYQVRIGETIFRCSLENVELIEA